MNHRIRIIAAASVIRALGFEPIGTYQRVGLKGKWHDVAWFSRGLGSDSDHTPAEPTPFSSEARAMDARVAALNVSSHLENVS